MQNNPGLYIKCGHLRLEENYPLQLYFQQALGKNERAQSLAINEWIILDENNHIK